MDSQRMRSLLIVASLCLLGVWGWAARAAPPGVYRPVGSRQFQPLLAQAPDEDPLAESAEGAAEAPLDGPAEEPLPEATEDAPPAPPGEETDSAAEGPPGDAGTESVGDEGATGEAGAAEEVEPELIDGEPLWEEGFEEAMECQGECGNPRCSTCKHWFFRLDYTMMQRNRARSVVLSRVLTVVNTSAGQVAITPTVFTTSSGQFEFEPGARFVLGRYLGRDEHNRDHTFETAYLGLFDWRTGGEFIGTRRAWVYPDSSTFPDANPNDGVAPPFHTFEGGTLLSDMGANAQGFSNADVHRYTYQSNLHDLQFNYRVRRGARRDQIVYLPGGWQSRRTDGWIPSVYGGLRFMDITEHFGFTSQGALIDRDETGDLVGPTYNTSGSYTVHTNNHLYGAQIGGDLTLEGEQFGVGLQAAVGLFQNFASQTSVVTVDDDSPFKAAPFPQFPTANYSLRGDGRGLAFVGEFGATAHYRLNPWCTFHFGINMMFVSGLALAPEQIHWGDPPSERLIRTGTTVFQGGNVGLEFLF